MVDVNVEFVLGQEEPNEAEFILEPDVTYTAEIVLNASTVFHDELYHLDYPDQHPIGAIIGLNDALSGLSDDIAAEENRAKNIEQGLSSAIDSNYQAISNHVSNKNNPHEVTKSQVGLGNVDNTSDVDKPVSTAQQSALDGKVDKVTTADRVYGTDSSGNQTTYDKGSFGQVDDVQVGGVSVVTNKIAELGTMASETASDYYTSAQVDTALSAKQDNLSAGTGIDITSNTVSVADPTLINNGTGTKALAVGKTSQSTAEGGVAVGYGAQANSTYSTAIGYDSRASNTNTTVIGKQAKATQARAIAIGSGAEATAQDAIAIKGVNNTANTFQVYTYNMLDMSTGLIPDARISTNIARTSAIPTVDQTYDGTSSNAQSGTAVASAVSGEATLRQNADNGLQSQIDAIVSSSDVFDIVGTYAELQAYDISTVPVNDIIKVLVDETHSGAATYYRCVENNNVKSWSYIGSEGAYYTKAESDNKFVPQTRTVNSKALSSDIILTASDVGALPSSTVIPTVNDATLTIQKNSTTVGTFTANQSTNATIDLSIPTDTNDLTNGAGYITASSLPTDYYTKSEIDSLIPQPTKQPIVYYQPTNSYCYDNSNNRFFGSHVTEKLYLVQPKTSGTTKVVDMSTTFSLEFTLDYTKATSSAFDLAEIITSYSSGKGVLLQLNSTGLYYRNNITGTTITGTRALTVGNSYDIKAEYDGTHMIIYYKLSSDATYTQINSTTCTADGSYYNYVMINMNPTYGNISLSSVTLLNGANTLYSFSAGKIALDYDTSLTVNASNQLKVVVDQTYDGTSTNPQSGTAIAGTLSDYVTTNTAQDISGRKTFLGEKAIYFKQSASTNKLGFTLYNTGNTEVGAFEYRPNTINGGALLNVNCSSSSTGWVGFRYWGTAVNIVAPKVATAGDYYIPINITDGINTVTATSVGTVNISSLIPAAPTVDQTYNASSTNAQSGVAIAGAGFITGITSSDVTTALGYTPYNSSNPDGYTSNVGTVTSVNNTSPDANGNVSISIPAAQVNSDWNANSGVAEILNKPTLASVATSGSYNDLTDKPTIPTKMQMTYTALTETLTWS